MPEAEKTSQEQRLAELDARLACLPDTETNADQPPSASPAHQGSPYGLALRIVSDLIAGVAVCLFLAWCTTALWWPEHRAMIMAFGGVCGIGIGIYNVWRAANRHFNPPA